MIAIVDERLIAVTIEKIAIEAVMIVNAMDRILVAGKRRN